MRGFFLLSLVDLLDFILHVFILLIGAITASTGVMCFYHLRITSGSIFVMWLRCFLLKEEKIWLYLYFNAFVLMLIKCCGNITKGFWINIYLNCNILEDKKLKPFFLSCQYIDFTISEISVLWLSLKTPWITPLLTRFCDDVINERKMNSICGV